MKFDNVVQYRFTSGFRKLIQKAAVSLGMKESVFVRVALRKELVGMGYEVEDGDVDEGLVPTTQPDKKKEKPSPDTVEPEQPSKSVHDKLADWMISDEPVKETQVFTEVTLKNTTAKFPTQENNFSRKGNVIVVMFRKGRGEFVLNDLNVTHVTFNQGGVDVNVIGKFSDFAGTCEITYSN